MIGSKANTDELIYQSKYIDLPEASNADRQTDTDGIKRDNKDWNFGLAEYSDTVGPPGERYFVTIYTRKLSLYNFRAYFHVAWRHGTSKEIYMAYNVGYLQHCVCSKCQVGSFQMICKQQSKNDQNMHFE